MSQQANIVAFDGASTPVSHTLIPTDNKVLKDGTRYARWQENLPNVPFSAQVAAELFQRSLKGGMIESRIHVSVPVMESISGQNASGYTAAPKVAYVDKYAFVSYKPARSTVSSTRIAKQLAMNIVNNVTTSVTPVSAGVVDEALAQGFMPT